MCEFEMLNLSKMRRQAHKSIAEEHVDKISIFLVFCNKNIFS